jgi:tyrosine-protein kinase Etk/Wzc
LRSQIMSKELQMQTLGRFATAQNPEMVRMAGELSVLRAQLKKLEEGTGQITPASPLQQEASQAFRDLKNQEAMLDAFVRQLEVAKLDEAKEGPAVQVLDVAIAPEVRAQPQRKKMVIAYAVVGLVIGLVLAMLKALLRYLNGTPSGRARLGQFRQAWGMGFLR